MKNIFKKFSVMALVISVVAAFALAPPAEAQTLQKFGQFITNAAANTITVAAATTNSYTTQTAVAVHRDAGIGVIANIGTTNAVGLTTVLNFAVSLDGTNYSTTFLSLVVPLNSSTAGMRPWTNWSSDVLNNARTIKLVNIVNNHTNSSAWYTNVSYFYQWSE